MDDLTLEEHEERESEIAEALEWYSEEQPPEDYEPGYCCGGCNRCLGVCY